MAGGKDKVSQAPLAFLKPPNLTLLSFCRFLENLFTKMREARTGVLKLELRHLIRCIVRLTHQLLKSNVADPSNCRQILTKSTSVFSALLARCSTKQAAACLALPLTHSYLFHDVSLAPTRVCTVVSDLSVPCSLLLLSISSSIPY